MRMTSKGQVTIPKHVRESAGIKPGAELDVVYDKGVVKILRQKQRNAGEAHRQYETWLKRVKGTATSALSTDDILKATRGRDSGISSR